MIGCSLACGAGDRLSDLDVAMGVRDDRFDAVIGQIRQAVDQLGELVESFHHQLPAVPSTHERLTSILDFAAAGVPAGLEATVADLHPPRLLAAARHLAAMLSEIGNDLPGEHRAVLPQAMARFITADLAAIADR